MAVNSMDWMSPAMQSQVNSTVSGLGSNWLGSLNGFMNSNAFGNLSKGIGVGLQGLGAYNQYKLGKEQNDLMKDAYNYNKSITDTQVANSKARDDSFKSVWG